MGSREVDRNDANALDTRSRASDTRRVRRFRAALRATVAVCLLALCNPYSLAAAATGKIPATANIFAAGGSALPAADGGAGTPPRGIRLPAATYRVVAVSGIEGRVTCCNTQPKPVYNLPQGRADFRTNLTGVGGISGVSMRTAMALVGVFVGASASAPPPTNTYTNRPAIGQVFYVALRSPDGVPVEFVVPEGATRLFFGIADGYSFQGKPGWYGDNEGFFRATVDVRELDSVPIASVSNGCGGTGWETLIPELFRNTSEFRDGGPFADSFIVVWTAACNLHDAGYDGAIVRDVINGGIVNYRGWSRKEVDDKFLEDMRLLCRKQIPPERKIALSRCLTRDLPISFGAENMHDIVRNKGAGNFDADPTRPGTQRAGPRTNN